MSAGARGLLLVLADPPPNLEEEFNAWYDTEHLPERAAIPGFENALRFRSVGDGPGYLAIYDLDALSVLEGDAYLAVSGKNFSPWTRRVTARSRPVRITARQIWPGQALSRPCARLLLLRFRGVPEEGAQELARELRERLSPYGVLQLRVFASDPEADALFVLAELSAPCAAAPDMGSVGTRGGYCDLAATYRPYDV